MELNSSRDGTEFELRWNRNQTAMELNSNREQGHCEGGRGIEMPVIGAAGGVLFGAKTVRPRPFGISTFGGRTVGVGDSPE